MHLAPRHARSLLLASALAALAALAAPLPGCKGTQATDNSCRSDADCLAPGTRCSVETQQCVCKHDEACPEGHFCNSVGICQARSGCSSNADCPKPVGQSAEAFCDIETGRCLLGPIRELNSACGLASHCPYGTVCANNLCVAGCFDDGDCNLGHICQNGLCASGENICSADAFCGYRERCVGAQCKRDRRGPFCRGCTYRTASNPEPCDAPKNFCLLNSLEDGGSPLFCGVDCSLGQPCPNGYDCNGVVILTDDECVTSAQCRCDRRTIGWATRTCTIAAGRICEPRLPDGTPDPDAQFCRFEKHGDCNAGGMGDADCFVAKGQRSGFCTCVTNDDCAAGATCVAGQCCGQVLREDRECAVGEARVYGFCTCATDDDCPQDSCDSGRGACAITGLPCTPGGNECPKIPCVDGGCSIGSNCAPIEGLGCTVVGGGG